MYKMYVKFSFGPLYVADGFVPAFHFVTEFSANKKHTFYL